MNRSRLDHRIRSPSAIGHRHRHQCISHHHTTHSRNATASARHTRLTPQSVTGLTLAQARLSAHHLHTVHTLTRAHATHPALSPPPLLRARHPLAHYVDTRRSSPLLPHPAEACETASRLSLPYMARRGNAARPPWCGDGRRLGLLPERKSPRRRLKAGVGHDRGA